MAHNRTPALVRPDVRLGSNATEMDRSRYVRFPPESDRIAEVPDWQLRASIGPQQLATIFDHFGDSL